MFFEGLKTVCTRFEQTSGTNLSLQLLVALCEPKDCPAHAGHLGVQTLAQRKLL